jgi:hypothetical protein
MRSQCDHQSQPRRDDPHCDPGCRINQTKYGLNPGADRTYACDDENDRRSDGSCDNVFGPARKHQNDGSYPNQSGQSPGMKGKGEQIHEAKGETQQCRGHPRQRGMDAASECFAIDEYGGNSRPHPAEKFVVAGNKIHMTEELRDQLKTD